MSNAALKSRSMSTEVPLSEARIRSLNILTRAVGTVTGSKTRKPPIYDWGAKMK